MGVQSTHLQVTFQYLQVGFALNLKREMLLASSFSHRFTMSSSATSICPIYWSLWRQAGLQLKLSSGWKTLLSSHSWEQSICQHTCPTLPSFLSSWASLPVSSAGKAHLFHILLTVAMACLREKSWLELGLWKVGSRTKPMTQTLWGSYRYTEDNVDILSSCAHEQMKAWSIFSPPPKKNGLWLHRMLQTEAQDSPNLLHFR